MPRFADMPLAAFLDALADPQPTPGGGTASAVAGAMGAALLMMVAGLKKTRSGAEVEHIALAEARASLTSGRDRILALADEDTAAFDSVMAAYRLPKNTDAEKAARKAASDRALVVATNVPLETLRTVAEITARAQVVAQYCNPAAASDVRVALELLQAAAAGAAANVQINIQSLADEAFRQRAAAEILELSNRITQDEAAARTSLP